MNRIRLGIVVGSLLICAEAFAQTSVPTPPPPGGPAAGAPPTGAAPAMPPPGQPIQAQTAQPTPLAGTQPGAEGTTARPSGAPVTGVSSLPRANAEYKLGAGDLIEVGVFGIEEYRHTVRISANGMVKLPLIDAVNAAGLTAAQLEEKLAEMLGGEVIKNPQVSVFVKEYRSQPVYVSGSRVSIKLRCRCV